MFFRTKHLLSLLYKNHLFNDSDLSNVINSTENKFIEEVFKYENFRKNFIEKAKTPNEVEYMSQLFKFRKHLNGGLSKILDLKIIANKETFIFSSNYFLHQILSPHKLALKDVSNDIFNNIFISEEPHYYCMRKSFVEEFDNIEYSLSGFGNLLIDIFDYNNEIKLHDLYDLIKNQYVNDDNEVLNDIFISFLSENFVKNYSIKIN